MAKRGRKPGQKGKCGVCGKAGHNARTCPDKNNTKKSKKSKTSQTKPVRIPQPKKVNVSEPVAESPKVAETKKKVSFDLDRHINAMLLEEPYFAALSRRINKTESYAIPTAGVCIDADTMRYQFLYNPDFMAKLPYDARIGVLLHEYFHLSLGHCSGRRNRLGLYPVNPKNPTQREKARLFQWNIATDLSINCHIADKLNAAGDMFQACIPGKGKFKNYPSELSAEEYFKLLDEDEEFQKQMQQQQGGQGTPDVGKGQNGSGQPGDEESKSQFGQFDSHENWEKDQNGNPVDGSVQDVAKEAIRDAMRKAVAEAAEAQSWGSVSTRMRDEIIKSLQGKLDWRKLLRYFIRTSQRANKSGSIRKINKRYAYIHPGKKVNRQAEIALCIDQSGSVSDVLLSKFFGELNKLAALATFTVVPFDHEVAEDKVYVWKRGQRHKTERVSCGGTCFQAPTDYCNKRNFDGMIILTDMEASQPTRGKCQRMWITDENHARSSYGLKPANGEKVVVIPE